MSTPKWTEKEQDRIDTAANKAYEAARRENGTDRVTVLAPVVDEARLRVLEERYARLVVSIDNAMAKVEREMSPHADPREAMLREIESYWADVAAEIAS